MDHRATGRVLDIFELLAGQENGMNLTDICDVLGAPKSSLFPILHTLEERGYLKQERQTRCYRIGQMAYQIGNSYLRDSSGLDELEKLMEAVVAQCGEACHLAVLSGGDVLYLRKVDSPHAVRMTSRVGIRLPAYGTGLGKALLTDYTLPMLQAMYPEGLKALTSKTITDYAVLEQQLKESRKTGFSYESEESNLDICCIAVPLRKKGEIVAAFSVAVPVYRYDDTKKRQIEQALTIAKQQAEKLLQFTDLGLQ